MIILPSAALEVESTTKGFLPPRMTKAQMKAIVNPAEGLIVYCTDCNPKCVYLYSGSNWDYFDASPIPATIASLNCASASPTSTIGFLVVGKAASGVNSQVHYLGGDGGIYSAQSIPSTGVTGLTATLTAGTLVNGNASLTYTITGTPSTIGTASFAISIGGKSCTLTRQVGIADRAYGQTINGVNNHNFVYFPVTGADNRTWLSNNLGAHYANISHPSFKPTQQATSSSDDLAHGSLFQWGRAADGHELITWMNNSATPLNTSTPTPSTTDTAANALFITINAGNYDWRDSQNNNLWQGVNGTNNPCPIGFRLPTSAEFANLVTLSSISSITTAANSALKLSAPGFRDNVNGGTYTSGTFTGYWTSSTSGTGAVRIIINSGGAFENTNYRALGHAVRCIKD
jgi:uncharacterized protein (TIGR02145 family)